VAVVTVTTQVSSATASTDVLVFPITGATIPAVILANAFGTAVAFSSQPNPSYTGTSIQVAVSGTVADATQAGPIGGFYGTLPFGIFNETGAAQLGANQVGADRSTAFRAKHVNLRDSLGTEVMDTTAHAVRTTLYSTTGTAVSIAANGSLNVSIVAGGGTGGTSSTDSSTFTVGSTAQTPIGGEFNDAGSGGASSIASGVTAAARITGFRALHTNLRSSSGTEISSTAQGWLMVSNQTLQDVEGPTAAGVAVSTKPLLAGGYASGPALSAVTAGQHQYQWLDLNGRIMAATQGVDPNGSAINGSAVLIGGWAASTPPTAAGGNGRLIPSWHDLNGRAHIVANVSSVYQPLTSSAISITLANLNTGTAVARSSAAIDNSAWNFLDALVTININGGRPGGNSQALLYAYGSLNGGTNYTEGNAGIGTDASYAINNPTALKYLGTVPMPYNSQVYTGGPFSVAAAFDGVLPPRWGIVVQNDGAFPWAATNSSAIWTGVARQLV